MSEKEIKQEQPVRNRSEKFVFNKAKLAYAWYPLWRRVRKAKKIARKIANDPNLYSEEYRYNFMKKTVRSFMKLLNIKLDVFGIENWLDKGVVLAINHQSNLDPLIMLAINDFKLQQPLGFIAKKELWDKSTSKAFVSLIDCLALDRNSPRSALNVMKDAKELITQYKRSMAIFPEGTRSFSKEMGEFQPASMKLAQMAYAPIIPVAIINSHEITNPKRQKTLRIKVAFGKPMMAEKFMSIKADVLTSNVKREVGKLIDKYWDVNPDKDGLTPKRVEKKDRCRFF